VGNLLHALAEPRRRRILLFIWDAEREAGAIHRAAGRVTFGAVSQHLRVLREAGAVTLRREGRRRLYRADRVTLRPLEAYLEQMWGSALDNLKSLAEAEGRAPKRRPKEKRHKEGIP
jgi:DNA-binding transcriptional ArsR family regulator